MVANIDFHPVHKLSSREALPNCVQFTSQRLNDKVCGGIETSLMRTDADWRRSFVDPELSLQISHLKKRIKNNCLSPVKIQDLCCIFLLIRLPSSTLQSIFFQSPAASLSPAPEEAKERDYGK